MTPDDIGGGGAEPYATARVELDASGSSLSYAPRFLPAGDYTIAVTCQSDGDDPLDDDDLDFEGIASLQLDESGTLSHDITD